MRFFNKIRIYIPIVIFSVFIVQGIYKAYNGFINHNNGIIIAASIGIVVSFFGIILMVSYILKKDKNVIVN